MENEGKLIIIEGVDGSGKATQTELLFQKLKLVGKKVKKIDFPQYYDNFFGELIGECLAGKHGDFVNFDPRIASILYACDRFETSKKIKEWIAKGYIVLSDRYVSSNYLHQGGKMGKKSDRLNYLRWLEKMEYRIFEIPRPDLIVYLNVSLKIAKDLLKNKTKKKRYLGKNEDVHEKSDKHLIDAMKSATDLVGLGAMKQIDCVRSGKILTKKQISQMVWGVVGQLIK